LDCWQQRHRQTQSQGIPVATIAAHYANAIIQYQPDILLVATYHDGLQSYDLTGRFLRQLSDKPFNVIMMASDGTYWLGSHDAPAERVA
jgi:hypothetical protein